MIQDLIQRNLCSVRARIAEACRRAGRAPADVTLIAVTKQVSAPLALLLYQMGQADLAESRPQELWVKHPEVPQARWHMIGHLQTNKVRRTLPLVVMVHSLDRWSLAECLSAEAGRLGRTVPILAEVNLTGEVSKHGWTAGELEQVYPRLVELPGLEIRGLMTMARWEEDPERCRPTFAALRQLADRLRSARPAGPVLSVLSMGMSNDFESAIEEGATHVRIGSALFEGTEGLEGFEGRRA